MSGTKYLPPKRLSNVFNVSDYNYQDKSITVKELQIKLVDMNNADDIQQIEASITSNSCISILQTNVTSIQNLTASLLDTTDQLIILKDLRLDPTHTILTSFHISNHFKGDITVNDSLTTAFYGLRYQHGSIALPLSSSLTRYRLQELRAPVDITNVLGVCNESIHLFIEEPTFGITKRAIKAHGISEFDNIISDEILVNSKITLNGTYDFTNLESISTTNLAMGLNAGNLTNLTATGNTIFGENSFTNITSENYNTAIGFEVGEFSKGTNNVYIGRSVGQGIVSTNTGSYNTACGESCMTNITTGGFNVGIGRASLLNMSSGSVNTAIGVNSGNDITNGGNNTLIGRNSGTSSSPSGSITTSSNVVCIGDSSVQNAYIQVALTVVSDKRDKCQITDFQFDSLEYINKLKPKQYFMNDRSKYRSITYDGSGNEIIELIPNDESRKDDKLSIGFISQDVQSLENKLLPNSIVCNDRNDEKLGIRYEAIIPILVQGMKQQQSIIDNLTSRIIQLEII